MPGMHRLVLPVPRLSIGVVKGAKGCHRLDNSCNSGTPGLRSGPMQISVRWKSKIDFKPLAEAANLPGYELIASVDDDGSSCDVVFMDVRYFSTQDQFEAALLAQGDSPKLIIVDGPEGEFSLIRRGLAKPLDELCHVDRTDEELVLRLLRLLGRVDTRRDSLAVD